mmetsp:Transcript_26893/g.56323  ORF Transcript_26893/g.56323 Transcript_26893/m.56323 type:complete len:119 (+) Transcript_26893:291-647(+)
MRGCLFCVLRALYVLVSIGTGVRHAQLCLENRESIDVVVIDMSAVRYDAVILVQYYTCSLNPKIAFVFELNGCSHCAFVQRNATQHNTKENRTQTEQTWVVANSTTSSKTWRKKQTNC